MKRFIAILLDLVMLCCGVAAGEGTELPYMETENQDVYVNTTLLTESSYPQVCVSPYTAYDLFESETKDPLYITFPCPDGIRCSEFDENKCTFLDAENGVQISYQGLYKYSYESFLDGCTDKDNILLDGTERAAVYINPDQGIARGLLEPDEIHKDITLYIYIALKDYAKIDPEERKETLKALISKEVKRIQASIRCESCNTYWTDGKYRGLKMASFSVPGLTITAELPEVIFHFDGDRFTGSFFPVSVGREKAVCYASENRRDTLIAEIEIDTFSYVFFEREEAQITRKTLSDGRKWGIFTPNEDGEKLFVGYASTVLSEKDRYGDNRPVYLNIRLVSDKGEMHWENRDSFIEDLDAFAVNIQTEQTE